jgi:hypothetical protein
MRVFGSAGSGPLCTAVVHVPRAGGGVWTCGHSHQKQSRKARRGSAGRAEGGKDLMLLRVDPIGALAALGLEGFDCVPVSAIPFCRWSRRA